MVENNESNILENHFVFETDKMKSKKKKFQNEHHQNGYSEESVDNCVVDGSSTKKKKMKTFVENNESNIPENHFVFETDNIKIKKKKKKNHLEYQRLKNDASTEEQSDNADVINTISHEKEANSTKEKKKKRKDRDKEENISFYHTKIENESFNNENEVVIKKKIKRKRKHERLLENNAPEKLEPVIKKKRKRSTEIDVHVQEEMSLIDIINKKSDIVIVKKKKKKKKHHSGEE